MSEPTFYVRDGEVFYRGGTWLPRPNADRLLASLRKSAADKRDPLRNHSKALAAELIAVMADAYHMEIAA